MNKLNGAKHKSLYVPCVRTNNVKHNSNVARVILVSQRSAISKKDTTLEKFLGFKVYIALVFFNYCIKNTSKIR